MDMIKPLLKRNRLFGHVLGFFCGFVIDFASSIHLGFMHSSVDKLAYKGCGDYAIA